MFGDDVGWWWGEVRLDIFRFDLFFGDVDEGAAAVDVGGFAVLVPFGRATLNDFAVEELAERTGAFVKDF